MSSSSHIVSLKSELTTWLFQVTLYFLPSHSSGLNGVCGGESDRRRRQSAPVVVLFRITCIRNTSRAGLLATGLVESVSCSTASELRLVGPRQGDSTLILGWNFLHLLKQGGARAELLVDAPLLASVFNQWSWDRRGLVLEQPRHQNCGISLAYCLDQCSRQDKYLMQVQTAVIY